MESAAADLAVPRLKRGPKKAQKRRKSPVPIDRRPVELGAKIKAGLVPERLPRPLTDRQRRFAEALAEGLNQTQAAKKAGYSAVASISATARDARVIALVGEIKARKTQAVERVAARVGMSKEAILREMADTYRAAREAGEFPPAVKALELLGREVGLFTERKKVEVAVGVFRGADDGQLARFVEQAAPLAAALADLASLPVIDLPADAYTVEPLVSPADDKEPG